MMGGWVVLGEVIGLVGSSRFPVDVELILANPILNPIETHVNGFRVFHLYSIIGDACSGAIVGLDGSGWLGMAKLGEGSPEGTGLLGIEEEGP
jgi:hypothetical protein